MEHYATQCRKLGLNLLETHAAKQFTFLNLLSSPYQWTDQVQPVENSFTSISEENVIQLNTSLAEPLKPIYTKLSSLVDRFTTSDKFDGVLIVIDSLNSLSLA